MSTSDTCRRRAADDGVERLPDPDPDDPRRSAEQRWWPPVMLRPDWAETADIDVFHVQFGFDTCTPDGLRELVGVLRRRGIPLVVTVHDLRNPHHADRREHDAQLDVLVPVRGRGRDPDARCRRRDRPAVGGRGARRAAPARRRSSARPAPCGSARRTGPWTVGLHVKSLRASMDPLAILPTLVEQVRAMPDARLLVNGHRDVLDDGGSRRDAGLASYLRDAERRGDLELHVHDYLSDDELWDYLAGLDVSVLPYRFGTHSGWLEACRDLGTTVVVPDCGYFADQGPVLTYAMGEDRYDADVAARGAAHGPHRPAAAGGPRRPRPPARRGRRRPPRALPTAAAVRPLRICIIGSSRFPIREPFAGGLEAHTHALARRLSERGHEVTLFAAPGSDPSLGVRGARGGADGARPRRATRHLDPAALVDAGAPRLPGPDAGADARRRTSASTSSTTTASTTCPVAMADVVPVPMVTTLHTPPTPWLRSALVHASPRAVFVAVSRCTSDAWAGTVASRAILNGVDTERWVPGPGGGPAVWSGRLVPEKAPHLAIDAARRAGMPLLLAGPVLDAAYVDREVRPRLGDDVRHVGHLDQRALCALVGSASVAVVTPDWEEPYGLVAAEAMACGTPVAALDRGAMREVVVEGGGVLADPRDPAALADGDGRRGPARPGPGAPDRRGAVLAGADGRRLRARLRAGPRAAAGGRVIGYYVHHHGHGHLHRAIVLADACRLPVVGLSSLPRPAEWTGEWVQLARDDDDPGPRDASARGQLHWAPLDDDGLRCRMATLSAWIAEHRPAVLVSDVSVEVAMLARLHGVPVVSVVLPGERGDAPHRAGLGLSSELVSFWPPSARGMVRGLAPADAARLRCLGALSRFGRDELAGGRPDDGVRRVVVLNGSGGGGPTADAARAGPGHVAGLGVAGARGALRDLGGRPDGGAARRPTWS